MPVPPLRRADWSVDWSTWASPPAEAEAEAVPPTPSNGCSRLGDRRVGVRGLLDERELRVRLLEGASVDNSGLRGSLLHVRSVVDDRGPERAVLARSVSTPLRCEAGASAWPT